MVGISGNRGRQVELVKKDGYEVVVFGGWPNWEKYFEKYVNLEFIDKDAKKVELRPELQWQWAQNYPELVVEDIVHNWKMDSLWNEFDTYDDIRDFAYGDLLYRGVNKWLMVRYLLVRYKKWVADERNEAWQRYERWNRLYSMVDWGGGANIAELDKLSYMRGYWRGYYDAMRKVRADLKTMCMTPRYVIWNGVRPGVVVDEKISQGWLELVKRLYDVRFEK